MDRCTQQIVPVAGCIIDGEHERQGIILQWKRNPYYQAFCGIKEFQRRLPCHSTVTVQTVHFGNRTGTEGVARILR